jgi:hypothetical protein
MRGNAWAVAALLALTAGRAGAAEFNMKVTAEDVKLGKHVVGPAVEADDLKYRVVLLEFWGVN